MPLSLSLKPCLDIEAAWPEVSRFLELPCKRFGVWSLDEAKQELLAGNGVLWVLFQGKKPCAALLTQVDKSTNNGMICLVGGSHVLAGASQHLVLIEDWAKANGAERMAMDGRNGWVRFLKAFGYRSEGSTVIKDL